MECVAIMPEETITLTVVENHQAAEELDDDWDTVEIKNINDMEEVKEKIYCVVYDQFEKNENACLSDAYQLTYYFTKRLPYKRIIQALVELAEKKRLWVEEVHYTPADDPRRKPLVCYLVAYEFFGERGFFTRETHVLEDNFFRDAKGRFLSQNLLDLYGDETKIAVEVIDEADQVEPLCAEDMDREVDDVSKLF